MKFRLLSKIIVNLIADTNSVWSCYRSQRGHDKVIEAAILVRFGREHWRW